VTVNLPDRRYEVAGELLATALEGGQADGLSAEANALGLRLGDEARRRAGARRSRARLLAAAVAVLGERGYEPVLREDGSLLLRNCPFDALAQRHRPLICGMNLSIMDGVLEGLRARGITAVLDPQPGRCCVVWGPAPV
jgi:predicted ArsR family transcriptional regulator